MVRYVRFYTRWRRRENDQFSTLRCTKTGSTQPKLSTACFVVQSCLADADFVVFSNYCLIGTRQKGVFYFLAHPKYSSYSFTLCLVYNGLFSIIISSTLLPKNSPPDCFLNGRLQIPSFSLYIKNKKHRKALCW